MKLERVDAGYNKSVIVESLSFEIKTGEIISIIGPNGGGKSTLLKTISGQLEPLGGSVFLGKDEIRRISHRELSRKLSIVTTERISPQYMTCRDVVLAGRHPYTDSLGRVGKEDNLAADNAISLMKIRKIEDKPFDSLSDGQKQRTLIARAICQEPEYLIMDEPTSYLDIRYRYELMDVIKELSGKNITVIMSLHEPELAFEISDRLLLIDDEGSTDIQTPKDVAKKELLKSLYNMSDEMYERIKKQIPQLNTEDEPAGRRHSSYFVNKKCEYYPCHDLPDDKFSCMFCYCPLYDMKECGGTYTYTDKGVKNCKNCTFPHDRDNYAGVIKKLKEKMYEGN